MLPEIPLQQTAKGGRMSFRTQAQVDRLRLPAGKTDVYEFDSECTGLSIRLQGKAKRYVGGAREGKDALAEREVAKARSGDTLLPLVQMFLERRAKPRQRARSYREAVYYLTVLWAPLHSLQVGSITRRDVASRLEEIRVGNG